MRVKKQLILLITVNAKILYKKYKNTQIQVICIVKFANKNIAELFLNLYDDLGFCINESYNQIY